MNRESYKKIYIPVIALVSLLHIILILFLAFPSLSGERSNTEERFFISLFVPNEMTLNLSETEIPAVPAAEPSASAAEPLTESSAEPSAELSAEAAALIRAVEERTLPFPLIIPDSNLEEAPGNPVFISDSFIAPEIEYYPIDMLTIRHIFPSSLILENIVYPRLARQQNIEGRVLLEIILEADGEIRSIRIINENPPNMGFAEAAINAFRGIRAIPAERNGIKVPARLEFPLLFNLN